MDQSPSHSFGRPTTLLIGAATALTLLIAAAVAFAAPGSLTFVELDRDPSSGGAAEGLDDAEAVAVSPDNKHAYVTGAADDTVVTFARNATTGGLSRVEEDRDPSSGGSAEGLDRPLGVAVSPDGKHVYVAASDDDSVVTFSRNATSGALTRVEQDQDPSSGGTAEGLDGASTVAISPDGKHVYVGSGNDDAVVTFSRNAMTGALTRVEEDRDPSSGGTAEGLDDAGGIVVSADGKHLYATSDADDTVVTFSRDATSGALTRVEEDRDPSSGGAAEGLDGARDVVVAADGKHVYVAAAADDTVVTFSRNATSGALTRVEEDRDPSSGGAAEGLDGARDVVVSPTGGQVYALGRDDDAVVTFSRNAASGALARVEEERDPSSGGTAEGLDIAIQVTVAPDGKHVYVTGAGDDTVVTFAREQATGPGDTVPPEASLAGKKKQRAGGKVKVAVTCADESCAATVAGKLKTSYGERGGGAAAAKKVSKTFKLKAVTKEVPAAGTVNFKLKFSKKAKKGLAKAIDNGGKAKAKITAEASDAAGNTSSLKRTIKLKG